MRPVEVCFKDFADSEGIRKAYVFGYRAGYEDGRNDRPDTTRIGDDIEISERIPIETMKLSTRAHRSLVNAGCRYVRDVATLSADKIRRLRNVGKVTAKEVVQYLKEFGITDTEWEFVWMIEW